VWETSPAGPFDRWPTPGNGFEYFYGFIGGETSQYYPALHEGIKAIEPARTPEQGYHLMSPRSGPTATRAASTRAGTRCASRPSRARRSSA